MATGGSTRAIVAAFIANLGIAAAKFVAFLFTRSSAMLAESIHSLADTGNQGLLLLGGHRAKRAPTEEHPFGFGRERYFWSFIVALVLFSLGGLFSLYEGIEKIRHPHPVESPAWAFGVLAVAVALEASSFRVAIQESSKLKGQESWPQFVRRSRQPELPVVLLEDLGALIGLVIALAAVALAVVTGDGRWDGLGSAAIGALLCCIALVLAVEMKSLLLGESATARDRLAVVSAIEASPSVVRLIHTRTQHLGPDELLVGAKIEFEHGLDIEELAQAVNQIEETIRSAVPIARVIYLEPDLHRGAAPDAQATAAGGPSTTDREHG